MYSNAPAWCVRATVNEIVHGTIVAFWSGGGIPVHPELLSNVVNMPSKMSPVIPTIRKTRLMNHDDDSRNSPGHSTHAKINVKVLRNTALMSDIAKRKSYREPLAAA